MEGLDLALASKSPDRARDFSDLMIRNGDVDWDLFDPVEYLSDNYAFVRDDDREIVEKIRDFFTAYVGAHNWENLSGLDVGTGSNLYPTLGMLPFCGNVEIREFSHANTAWLEAQAQSFGSQWDDFWDIYRKRGRYADIDRAHVRRLFANTVTVCQDSIFHLPRRRYDLGTMFFVACSISADHDEFRQAVKGFLQALKPGSAFAAAFMTNSEGYLIGKQWFPAVSVDRDDIAAALDDDAIFTLSRIGSHVPVRPGVGMVLATGFAR